MKNIMLDHVRRWWWVFVLGGTYASILGWSLATPDFSSRYWHGKHPFLESFFKIQSTMLVMQCACLAVFTGTLLLFSDLQRGLIRSVAGLPLTGRQLGRSWWLTTVAVPSGGEMALLTLGAGLFYVLHPSTTFPVRRLLLADLLIFLWSGSTFVTYFTNYATQGLAWGKLYNVISGVLGIWMMFGFGLNLKAQKNPVMWEVFIGIGLLLTAFGWWRAGQFTPGQTKPLVPARSRLRTHAILTPLPIKHMAGLPPAAVGSGGIPLLGRVTFFNAFLFCLIAAVWMPSAFAWQGHIKSWPAAMELVAGLVAAYWAICFFVFMPVLRQLRYLRTLPLSPSRLALVLLVLALLPLLTLGALTALVAWLSTDASITLLVLKNFLFILAPASLCLAVAVWRGTGIQTYVVLLVTLIGFQAVCYRDIPLHLVGAGAAIGVLLSYLVARLALCRSSHAYRVPTTPFGNWPGVGSK